MPKSVKATTNGICSASDSPLTATPIMPTIASEKNTPSATHGHRARRPVSLTP